MGTRLPNAKCFENGVDDIAEFYVKTPLPSDYYATHSWVQPPSREHAGVRTLGVHGGHASCVSVTPDGERLVVGCYPDTIKIYRLADGKLERNIGRLVLDSDSGSWSFFDTATPKPGKNNNFVAAFDHERGTDERGYWEGGRGIVQYGRDWEEREILPKKNGHKGEVVNLVVTNTRIISSSTGPSRYATLGSNMYGCGSPGQTKLWDLTSGQWICDLGNKAATAIAVSPDDTKCAVGLGNQIKIVSLSDGSMIRKVAGDVGTYSLAFSLAGDQIFIHSESGVGRRDIVASGYQELEESMELEPLFMLPRDREVMMGLYGRSARASREGEEEPCDDLGRTVNAPKLQYGRSQTIAVTPEGKIVATDGKSVVTWGPDGDLESEVPLRRPRHEDDRMHSGIETFALAPDGSQVLLGGPCDSIPQMNLFDAASGLAIATLDLRINFAGSLGVVHATFSKSNQYIATVHQHPDGSWDGFVCAWRGRRFFTIRHDRDGLFKLLLLCRTGRAELMPDLVEEAEDVPDKNDRLSILVRLASGEFDEGAGQILDLLTAP